MHVIEQPPDKASLPEVKKLTRSKHRPARRGHLQTRVAEKIPADCRNPRGLHTDRAMGVHVTTLLTRQCLHDSKIDLKEGTSVDYPVLN
jgi:hypothetical protein